MSTALWISSRIALADSFSEWLRRHPEIATISRDRCGIYAEGAALRAPQSQQIADRFHLVVNLSATMERVLEERSRELILPPVEQPATESQPAAVSDASAEIPQALPRPTQSQLRRQRRLERYEQVMALFKSGHSQRAISRALGLQRKTIRRWLRSGQFPKRKPPHRPLPKVNEFASTFDSVGTRDAIPLRFYSRKFGTKATEESVPWWRALWPVGEKPEGPIGPTPPRESHLNTLPSWSLAPLTR